MRRKLIYMVFFLVVLACTMGPAIYAHKISSHNQAAERSPGFMNSETATPAAGGQTTPADSSVKGGGQKASPDISVQSTGPQAGNGLAAGETTARKSNPTCAAGRDSTTPAQKAAGMSSASVQEDGYTVGIAVVGMDGELLYGPGNVTVTKKSMWDATALGALEATGLPYSMSTRWSSFVEAVAGQRNKGQAGWMYMVNNEISMVAADQKQLQAGDKVVWWYSKSMADPRPEWDKLLKQM